MNEKINLLPEINSGKWETYVPPVKSIAEFSKKNGESLNIKINSKSYGVGKWITEIPVEEEKSYDFSVKAKSKCDVTDIYVIVTLYDKNRDMIIRDHIRHNKKESDGILFYDKIEAPKNSVSLKIELWLKGYECEAEWCLPTLTEGEAREERNVRAAVAYIPPHKDDKYTIEQNVSEIFYSLERCAEEKPDIIVLGECMYERGVPRSSLAEYSQTDCGKMCRLISEKAKEYNSYIIYNFHEYDGGEYYNTSILFDRKGLTAGKYRKTHLTAGEYEDGMTPGFEYPVFETDFGKIGMLICFDHYFTETTEKIVENGAEIIFISSAGDAAEKCIARAMDTGVYLAVCGWNNENCHGWGPGRIVAPDGSILSHTDTIEKPAFSVIDLNKPVRRNWLSLGPADSEIYGVYKYEKNIHCK